MQASRSSSESHSSISMLIQISSVSLWWKKPITLAGVWISNLPQDSTYQIAIWSVVETGLGITASSLFTLRPLFRWLLDEKLSYGRNTRSQGRDYNKYPLSSLNNDGLRVAHHSGNRSGNDGKMVNTATIPPLRDFMTGNSSEEALYPEPNPITSGNYVTVSRTFVQTISERTK